MPVAEQTRTANGLRPSIECHYHRSGVCVPGARRRLEGTVVRINPCTYVAVVAVLAVVVPACSSSSSPSGGSDAGSDSGSSSGGSSGGDSGSQCPAGQTACNNTCCDPGAVCADDGITKQCAEPCTSNSGCPKTGNSCCALLPNGQGACLAPGTFSGQQCLCATQSDCYPTTGQGCCAPVVDSNKNPTSTYVCKSNFGGAYECCQGGSCSGGYCCLLAAPTNNTSPVCFETCQTTSNCGGMATCVQIGQGGTCPGGATHVCQ
jgi:hypothetical protein